MRRSKSNLVDVRSDSGCTKISAPGDQTDQVCCEVVSLSLSDIVSSRDRAGPWGASRARPRPRWLLAGDAQ